MPWTVDNPPPPAKNWDKEAIKKCVPVANAVLEKTKDKTKAIQACIRAAGKTVHPGGKGKGALFLELPESMDDTEFCKLAEQADQMGLGFVSLGGTPTEFEIEYEDGHMMALGAAVSPDIDFRKVRALYFRNAILAREESNKNKDDMPSEEIDALARTIGGMPIDDEHEFEKVVGAFTKGRRVQDANGLGAVSVDGLIWPQRFPDIARETVEGKRRLSMEVWIASATCSMCSETFTSAADYCAHLRHREARRQLHGVQGFGGALTIKPAGTDTVFDADAMMVVASHHREDGGASEEFDLVVDIMDDEEYVDVMAVLGGWIDEATLGKKLTYQTREGLSDSDFALVQTKTNERTGKKIKVRRFPIHDCSHAANALARLPNAKNLSSSERGTIKRKAQAKLGSDACKGWRGKMKGKGADNMTDEERIAELQQELETAQGRTTELEGELATAKQALEDANAAAADLQWSMREQALLQAGYDADKLKTEKDVLAAISGEAFDILVSALAAQSKADTETPDESKKETVGGSVVLSTGGGDEDGDAAEYELVL